MLNQILDKINNKTKPLRSLGMLEDIAVQVCTIQNTLTPRLIAPHILVFAADHGIARDGVSAYPPEVTPQMVMNFLNGGAAINVFCRQHHIGLTVVDAGVNYDFLPHAGLINARIASGTRNLLTESAMSQEQLAECFSRSEKIVGDIAVQGTNIIGFGEMGIGNTSSASLLMASLLNIPIEECVGRGTGLNDEQLLRKKGILQRAIARVDVKQDGMCALREFGGFEIAQICAGMLAAFRHKMIILVDGFIASAAFLAARTVEPDIVRNAVFCHKSNEQGHQKMLEKIGVKPLLGMDLRLGEGIGCALAYPLIQSAVAFINEMASFDDAGVSKA